MTTDAGIHTFVLHELRLRDTADREEAARIVEAAPDPTGQAVPLLTSIEDDRDVAVVRAFAGDTWDPGVSPKLDGLVATRQPPQRYVPRITERTEAVPTHYRLAVTGSGINNAESDPGVSRRRDAPENAPPHGARTSLDLLWIGVPLGTYAGSLVLVGSDDGPTSDGREARGWPVALSRSLGVRIYDSRR